MDILKKLIQIPSISGCEEMMSLEICSYLDRKSVRYEKDSCGNVIVGNYDAKILLVAHMDEVGCIVTGYTPDGMLCTYSVGGLDKNNIKNRAVHVYSGKEEYLGRTVYIDDRDTIYIDIGASSYNDAKTHIKLGSPVSFYSDSNETINRTYISSGIDNKIGIYILLKVLEEFCTEYADIAFAFTVGEETNKIGASFISKKIKPELCIIVDATPVSVTGDLRQLCEIRLNGGAVINISNQLSSKFINQVECIVDDFSFKLQKEISIGKTHTDADIFLQDGIQCAILSYPVKGMHSSSEMCNLNDVGDCIGILKEYLRKVEL